MPVGGGEFDKVVVPKGYTAQVLVAWGDPVSNGPAFKQDASNTSADQEQQWGMHNDGMVYFPLLGSSHGLLVQNHEYTDDVLLFSDGAANWNAEKTKKSRQLMASASSRCASVAANGKWCGHPSSRGGSRPTRRFASAARQLGTTC